MHHTPVDSLSPLATAELISSQLSPLRSEFRDLLFAPTPDAAFHFLTNAPIDCCLGITSTWHAAESQGIPSDQVLAALDVEDRHLTELIIAMFGNISQGGSGRHCDPELVAELVEGSSGLEETVI